MRVEQLKSILSPPSLDQIPRGDANISSVVVLLGWNRETEGVEIVLTKRTQLVETHKGQVSFPGGYWESHDKHVLETALRETDEEIGAKSSDIEVIGALEPVITRGEVLIYPWVGVLQLPYPFSPNPGEVERLMFLPLIELISEGLQPVEVEMGALKVKSTGITVGGELVWGATARMLEQLRALLLNPKI
jgi:8-oxo-dGTP pyrophosphatase MutT (NUDIX family)